MFFRTLSGLGQGVVGWSTPSPGPRCSGSASALFHCPQRDSHSHPCFVFAFSSESWWSNLGCPALLAWPGLSASLERPPCPAPLETTTPTARCMQTASTGPDRAGPSRTGPW